MKPSICLLLVASCILPGCGREPRSLGSGAEPDLSVNSPATPPPAVRTAVPTDERPQARSQAQAQAQPQVRPPLDDPSLGVPSDVIPRIRIGREAAPDGHVPDAAQTDVVMWQDPIHIEVAPVPPGSSIRLEIHAASGSSAAWSTQATMGESQSALSASLNPGALEPGQYELHVLVGGVKVAEHPFAVAGG